jgi:hypothetical protein
MTDPDAALVHALGALAERCLDQEPHPTCCLCHWHAAMTVLVFLADDEQSGVRRGCTLLICGPCLCLGDLQARVQAALTEDKRKERALWN